MNDLIKVYIVAFITGFGVSLIGRFIINEIKILKHKKRRNINE